MSGYDSMLANQWENHCAAQEEAAFEEQIAWGIEDAMDVLNEANRVEDAIPCDRCDTRDDDCGQCGGSGLLNAWTVGESVHAQKQRLELLRVAGSILVKTAKSAAEL